MKEPDQLSASEWKQQLFLSSLITSTVTVCVSIGYFVSLLELANDEWGYFVLVSAVIGPAVALAIWQVEWWRARPAIAHLDALARGTTTPAAGSEACRAVSRLPRWCLLASFVGWSLGALAVVAALVLRFDSVQPFSLAIILTSVTSGAFVSSVFGYFGFQKVCRPVLAGLAAGIGEGEERRRVLLGDSLRLKLIYSVTGVGMLTVLFALVLSMKVSGHTLERNATRVQLAFLQHSLESAVEGGVSWEVLADEARDLEIADDILLVDSSGRTVGQAGQVVLNQSELRAILEAEKGTSERLSSPNAFGWMRLHGGELTAVAVANWSGVRAGYGESGLVLFLTMFAPAVMSLLLAILLSRDLAGRTAALKEAADRLASGDLRAVNLVETQDEIGELAGAFESMARALRETVGGVARAADAVEFGSNEVASITERVASGADMQRSGVADAVVSMDRMNGQAEGIAGSAQALNMLVEESSSSILEMGAAGDELNDTAGVLSSRVEEVSSSVEQMVRSVKEVNSHTTSLSEAASDTSSSMEEMASAMRQVDNIADEAARLSQHVVEAAEGGQATVQETIEGMESIRQATAAAESVIAGLGTRTQEIGSILDVIDDVADETNLLALNAAIIAAQAGEHGRAFTVVADEIKELADRVLSSTKEIGGLIHAVQVESGNAIGAIAEGSRSVAEGVERSRNAGAALEEITRSSRESGQRIEAIVRSVREQSTAANHVVEMMESVNNGVDAIHRATGEQDRGNEVVYRSTVAMREVAQQLRATTEEQARGGARIRESIEGVRGAVDEINEALQSQSSSCQEVLGFLAEVSGGSQANDTASDRLAEASQALLQQAEALREDVRNFILDA